MAERELKKKQAATREAEVVEDEELPTSDERGEKLKEDLDDLLDEIDEVLETNAEEFVKGYIQKGGQ